MKRSRFWLAAALLCAGTTTFSSLSVAGETTSSPTLEVYRTPEGRDYAAVGLSLSQMAVKSRAPEQVLVLVDTSASQMGEYREQSISVVRELLSQLPEQTSAAVWAIDLSQTALTDSFETMTAEKVNSITAALNKRIPAGSTDLSGAVEASLKSFDTSKSSVIVYVGDGFSAANLIPETKMQELTNALAEKQTPFVSYALGSQVDMQLLGVLALRSGGFVLQDQVGQPVNETVAAINKAISTPVWYPSQVKVTEGIELYPNAALPLRSDRETIYLGKIDEETKNLSITLSDDNNNQIGFNVENYSTAAAGHPALRALWLRADQDKGLSVPTAGQVVLSSAKNQFELHVAGMLEAANSAAHAGKTKESVAISHALLQFDPSNKAATKLLDVRQVALLQDDSVVVPGEADEETPTVVPGENPDLEGRTDAPTDIEQDLIQRFKNRSKAAGEKLALEVNRAIEQARSIVQDDPDAAISLLKGMAGNVRIASDIDPDLKRNLERKLLDVTQQVRAQREQIRNNRIRFEQQLAETEARRRAIESMYLEEERLEQLIDQVRALLDDGFHGEPAAYAEAEAVAEAAVELVPFDGTATAAQFTAEAAGQLEDARYLRALRADRFLETLTQVEFSHVPFPDEPPIRYPAAPVWKALTERRSIWKSVDLKNDSAAERRIRAALEEETELQFVDTPLIDALGIIGELHNINIRLDVVTLDDEGISTDEPVNIFISGIRLKSALKIMLEQTPTPVELTWIVEDEVMKITTVLKAEEATETRVYPVTDLVIPVQQLGGGGGLLGGGGVGGQGGGIGGQGGGQFGGGGGQFGGGGGGGFFSIPPATLPTAKKNQ